MSYYNNGTIRLRDVSVDVDLELEKSDVLSEFETDELLEAVREAWTDQEILDELDPAKVEAWADDMNEPAWAFESVYSAYSDEEKRQLGIPRRLKF